jgi:dihydrofolate reductase
MSKKLNIIVTFCKLNRGFGLNGKLAWPFLKENFDFLNKKTLGNAVIMGRKTFESIGSKPLPKRENVVITSTPDKFTTPNVKFVPNFVEALKTAQHNQKIFVVGGLSLFNKALKHKCTDKLYVTEIDGDYPADLFFPEIPSNFKESEESVRVTSANGIPLEFKTYTKE